MVVGVDMEEVPSVVRTQLRSIGVQPMLLVGLLNPWQPTNYAAEHLFRYILIILINQIAYGIGIAEPLSVFVNSYGTVIPELCDYDLQRIVEDIFDLRPGVIIRDLNLKRPIYKKTAHQGHFGRNDPDFTWEQPKNINWQEWKSKNID